MIKATPMEQIKKYAVPILVVLLVVIAIIAINAGKPKTKGNAQPDEDTGITVGKYAPDFELESLDGTMVQLNDFRGKKVVLNFWASWCPPCREEMPEFQKIHEQNKDIVIVGVNLQEKSDAINAFTSKFGITFPILLDPNAQVKEMYNVFTQPVTYFIDEAGKITDKKFGALTLEEIHQKIGSLDPRIQESAKETSSTPSNQISADGIKFLPDGTRYLVHPNELQSGGPTKDGIPSIDSPKFVTAIKANEFLENDEIVIGISRNGITRAYPFQILVWHELVNDELGGEPILISYCPLCGTAIAFKRTIGDDVVEFGVSGKLYNSDMVMYDRKTDSYWQQATGEAIIGELAGMRLEMVSTDIVRWEDWKMAHPDTQVLSLDTGYSRSYGDDPYGNYYTSPTLMFGVENEDRRLPLKEVVYGIEVDGKYKAYPNSSIDKGRTVTDAVGEAALTISKDELGMVSILRGKEEIIPVRSFWFAWAAFHPETELYKS